MRLFSVNLRLKLIVWLAPVVLGIGCSGKTGEEQGNATSSQGSDATPAAVSSAAVNALPAIETKDLSALVDLIVADAAELPRTEFETSALARSLGSDPHKHFEWVRSHTWWVPYRGLLRGAQGVLLDRVGSNLDRAVLLADLLRTSGHSVRLVHAQISEAQASELIRKTPPLPERRLSSAKQKQRSVEREKATAAILPGLEVVVEQQAAQAKRHFVDARQLVNSQIEFLEAAIQKPANVNGDDARAAIAAMQDYWWVEHEKDGNWIAMDVQRPDGVLSPAFAANAETFTWNTGKKSPSIPDANWHTVQVRVVVERHEGSRTSEFVVLETSVRPAQVIDRPVSLLHMPSPWPERPSSKTDSNERKSSALWVSEWVPFLQIGDDFVVQSGFTERGELKRNPIAPLGELGGGGLLGGMDHALGGGDEEETTATAEWIEYEIQVPGAPSRKIRRPVFDLLGPARRASNSPDMAPITDARKLERFEALASRVEILLQACSLTPEFVAHLASADIVENQAAIKEFAKEKDPTKAGTQAADILDRIDPRGPLNQFVLLRADISSRPNDWYIAQPNVFNYRLSLALAGPGHAITRELIDVVANPIAVRDGANHDHFAVRLHQGVSDTVAEMLAIGAPLRGAENTAAMFGQLSAEGDRGVVINSLDVTKARNLPWPPDELARVSADVQAGNVVVVPRKPVRLNGRERTGWWRVHLQTGETIGVMDTGFNAATTDQTNLRAIHGRLLKYKLNNYRDRSMLRRMASDNMSQMSRRELDDLVFYNRLDKVIDQLVQAMMMGA